MDDTEAETDRSTAAERVPVRGAYNITDIGDSAKAGWHELEHRVIKWRNLRWWALGTALIAAVGWGVLWVPAHVHVTVAALAVAALMAIPAVKVLRWYIETAEKYATLRLRRKQARTGAGR